MQNDRETGEITEILSKWKEAKEESLDIVFPKVYNQLKQHARKARRKIGRVNPGETLSTTALVNDVYLKLLKNPNLTFESRAHFYVFCRVSMQHLLHDYYLRKSSKIREVASLDESGESKGTIEDLVNLSAVKDFSDSYNSLELSMVFDEALTKIQKEHPRKVEVVILKYWLDETEQEIAEHLSMSKSSVRRDLAMAIPMIRKLIDSDMKSSGDEAFDLKHPTLRSIRLEEAADDETTELTTTVRNISMEEFTRDKNYLSRLAAELREKKRNKN